MFLLKDLRLALRLLWRAPAVTSIALLSISLSVGATAVVFTAIKSVLIDPLPYSRVGQLVQIRTEFDKADPGHMDWAFWNDVEEIRRRTRTLQSVSVYRNAILNLSGDAAAPEALYGLRISANLFPTLGVTPMLGRNILPQEDQPGHPNELILSYGLWVRRFNADPQVVGRNVNIDGHACLIIGVMAPEFNFPLRRAATQTPSPYVEFWAPLRVDPTATSGALGVVARLRDGVSLNTAQEDLASISETLTREFPATNRGRSLRMGSLTDRTVGSSRRSLGLLMAAALLFLLIGCANVANLLLARGLSRQREIAIRMAIGALSWRIVRQLLTESCVLALLGGLGGYILAAAAWKVLPAMVPVSIPRLAGARADWSILVFALGLALINGVLFGIVPALRACSSRTIETHAFGVRGATSGGNRFRGSIVVAEVAISVALIVVGGQLLGNFVRLLGTDPGFEADRVLASVVIPSPERYGTSQLRAGLYKRFLESVRSLPGVASAGTIDALPFSGENHGGFVSASEGGVAQQNGEISAEIDVVSAEYLQTMGVRLIDGRWFREEEMKETSDAAIVNDIAARRLWPNASAVGQLICVYCTPENPRNWKRVIGIVSAIRHAAMDGPEQASVYLSAGAFERAYFLVVRTNQPYAGMENAIRRAIAGVDPNQPVFLSVSMRTLISDSLADRRFIMSLLAVTACLALLMSAAGVYGVMAYTTSRRAQEIGVRMALGATRADIQLLIFGQGFATAAMGLAIGTASSLVLMKTLRGMLAGLETGQPGNIWLACGLVSVTAAIACWIPARRATKTDPMLALRQE
jgi:putative ABC transport system permease protein